MNTDPIVPIASAPQITTNIRPYNCISWSAVLAGTVAAIGLHLLFTALGLGAGLATFTPLTDAHPAANFSVGAALVWSFCALFALWFGGLVAGRFSKSPHTGFVHGILVWSLTLNITILLVSAGTGMMLGGAIKVLGEGLGIGAKAVTADTGNFMKEGFQRTGDQLNSFTQEAVESIPTNATPKAATRAQREVGFAVAKLFAPGADINSQDNRSALISSLMEYTEMSRVDAERTVDDWTRSYKNLEAELDKARAVLDQKARVAAERAAHNLACAALWSFFALLIGLLLAALGGRCGERRALHQAGVEYVGY